MHKTILITGASSGLGAGMAEKFAEQGCNLCLCARRLELLEKLKQDINDLYPTVRVSIQALDVDDHQAVFEAFQSFSETFHTIDRFIINAGIGRGGPIGKGFLKPNLQTLQTNLISAAVQCEAAVEILRKQNKGHLVVISSMSAFRGMRGAMTAYASSKAGIATFAEGIRMELLNTPIKVTTLFPGFILTDINKDIKDALFRVPLDEGVAALVKAINKEPAEACVPSWPWKGMKYALKGLPLSVLRKM